MKFYITIVLCFYNLRLPVYNKLLCGLQLSMLIKSLILFKNNSNKNRVLNLSRPCLSLPLKHNCLSRQNKSGVVGDPREIRTPDTLIRSQVLYPAELLGRIWQGQRDSNPQPTVLETVALSIALCPCIFT